MSRCTICKRKTSPQDHHMNGAGSRRAACARCERKRSKAWRASRSKKAKPAKPASTAQAAHMGQPKLPSELLDEHRRDRELRLLREEKKQLVHALETAEARAQVVEQIQSASLSLPSATRAPKKQSKQSGGMREATPVVMCSDWHIEEEVSSEKTNGMNEYTITIADHRISRLSEGILWLLDMHRTKFVIDDFVLWLGGDLFSGYIHEELIESNQLSPVESVLWLQSRLRNLIDTLVGSGKVKTLYVPCSYGNHGRTTQRKRISTGAENSYEWMMYQQLAFHYRDSANVKIIAPKSQLIYLDVYDFTLRFAHGDQISYQGGIGGLTIPAYKKIAAWDVGRRADITCIGHFHQYLSLSSLVTNGSLIGFNPYAISIGARYEPPQQAFFLLDSKRGKTLSTPIWVDHV